jgi:hypothetical protein
METLTFGRLTILRVHSRTDKHTKWVCQCECGNETVVYQYKLRNGTTKSCGCLQAELNERSRGKAVLDRRKHTRKSYYAMINRCTNPSAPAWPKYGAKGVTVCDRWRFGENGQSGWVCFFADMGPRPLGTSIDRINNDLGYFPNNCRWATQQQQLENRRLKTKITPSAGTLGA